MAGYVMILLTTPVKINLKGVIGANALLQCWLGIAGWEIEKQFSSTLKGAIRKQDPALKNLIVFQINFDGS